MPDNPAIGIDLGTTTSVVAHLDPQGRPTTLPNAEGDLTTPSVVFFDAAGPIVGKEAVKAGAFDPEAVAAHAKRDIGLTAFHRPVRGHQVPPEVIEALVLKKLMTDAQARLGEIRSAVVTVPAYFNEPRRKATQDAGSMAGLDVLDIINEPTAAAITHGVERGLLDEHGVAPSRQTVLVYDLGGGTFDATVMALEGNRFEAVATAGDVHLGGIDFDRRIVDHVAGKFLEQFDVDPREDRLAMEDLSREAEDAKRALSAREEVTIHFRFDNHRLQLPFNRNDFESITADLLDRTIFTVRRLLASAGLTACDVPRILLVGGSTRMPMVARELEETFQVSVDQTLSPDEAVAHGAALYAGFLLESRGDMPPSLVVKNVNSHDLGVLAIERETELSRRHVQIPRNTSLPATGKHRFHTHRDNQRSVGIPIIEGGDASGRHATEIGRCVIRDLPADLPARTPIDVVFRYAENGRLTVEGELPTVGCRATLSIRRSGGMDEELLTEWRQRIAAGVTFEETEAEDEAPDETPTDKTPDDTIVFRCPNGHKLSAKRVSQGQKRQCPKCDEWFYIPKLAPLPAPPEPTPEDEPTVEPEQEDPGLDAFLSGLGDT